MTLTRYMKVAIVHDYLVQYGGAERVFEKILTLYPKAPIYTLLYNPESLAPRLTELLQGRQIITSALQRFPGTTKHHRLFPLLMPYFIEQFDLSEYDVVISDTSSFAKGIITKPQTIHISYCHTPTRYAWDNSHQYIREYRNLLPFKPLANWGVHYLRIWDQQAAQRVDHYIANSFFVKKRIKKYYRRNAKVIYPPIETKKLKIASSPKRYYLLVNRLLPYKKTALAIEAFNRLGLPLIIVGRGPEEKYLKKIAHKNIKFLGNVYGKDLRSLYRHCQALIFPQEEDFGIAPVEVMASGRPVVAYRSGGAIETVTEGVSGIFFDKQEPQALVRAVRQFQALDFKPRNIRKSVLKFDEEVFKKNLDQFIKEKWQQSAKK